LSENIVKQIQRAGLVIADISAPNANVFYELGIADTIGRDVFLLYEKNIEQNLPADIQGAHYYAYDRNNIPESVERFAESLIQWKADYRVDITLKYCRK
jgi:predicted nucleotide-binding protein